MNTIPAWYWMIVVGVVTSMFTLILYHIAMLVRESTGAVKDSRELIRNSNVIIKDSAEIVSTVKASINTLKGTVDEINDAVVKPVRSIGGFLKSILG